MRVAVVHHWFVTRGGGERVAECIAALFPQAELFTLVANEAGLPATLAGRTLHTSFLDRLPLAHRYHRHFLPLFPAATEQLDLRGFDLVLSSDSGPVKGVRVDPGATHLCYCHSPMRYLWDAYDSYHRSMPLIPRTAFALSANRVRRWDAAAAQRVTKFLANSAYVAARIERYYGRQASVLHPPIDLERAEAVASERPGTSYLCAGRLVPYKRTELLVEACRRLGRPLRVVGTGPELARLQRLAKGDSRIIFLGALSDDELWAEYARCRALLFAADEDFGMVPLEAQACGRPVIAYGAGGSLETVRGQSTDYSTGLFFEEQTASAVEDAILQWEQRFERSFHPEHARSWAAQFSTSQFLEGYRDFVLRYAPAAETEMASSEQALQVVSPGSHFTPRTVATAESPMFPESAADELPEEDQMNLEALR